jgi:hypothetical protein
MSRMSDWSKLRALTWTDRWLLLQAFGWLGLIRILVALLPFVWIASLFRLKQGEDLSVPDDVLEKQAARIGWAVRAAARRQPWDSTCLTQAIAGAVLLRQRGIHSTFYLGVTKELAAPKELVAHAWLRCGETILAGAAGHERFTVVSSFKT